MMDSDTAHGVPKAKAYHYIGDFFNTLKAFIGTNYLSLPFAFLQSGLMMGIGGVCIIAAFTDYCCNLLVQCKYKAIDNIVEDAIQQRGLGVSEVRALRLKLERTVGYGDLGGMVLGRWCRVMIDVAVVFTQFLTIVCYYIFLGNAFFTLFPAEYASIPVNGSHPISLSGGMHYMTLAADERLPFASGVRMLDMFNINKRFPYCSSEDCQEVPIIPPSASPDEGNADATTSLLTPSVRDALITNVTMAALAKNSSTTTVVPSNTTTGNTTHAPTSTTPLPDPKMYITYLAPSMMYLVMIPTAFFLITSLIRQLRWLSPFTVIATLTLFAGAISVFVFLVVYVVANGVSDTVQWVKFATLPLFIGQLIGAYEGIGCLLPIESSMEGNRHVFPYFIHGAVVIVWMILTGFGIVGYLGYGEHVEQIIIRSMSTGVHRSVLVQLVDVTLIVSVFCTYPLQAYPVINIVEGYLFGKGCGCTNRKILKVRTIEPDDSYEDGLSSSINPDTEDLMEDVAAEAEEVTLMVPEGTPGYQRNILRIVITLAAMGCGIWLRDSYAIVSSFSGAIGASLLAYILPCMIHFKLTESQGITFKRVVDVLITCLAVAASVMTIIVIVLRTFYPSVLNL